MANFLRRSAKTRSSAQQSLNLGNQEPPRSPSPLRNLWPFQRSSTRSLPRRGSSPTPTTTQTPPATRPPPVVSPPPATPPATSATLVPLAILVHIPATTASPPVILPIERIWQRSIALAQEKLKEKNLPLLDLSDPTLKSVADTGSTIGDLKGSIAESASGRRFRKTLKTVDSYAKIVDTAVQSNPAITALVWAGVRAILQVR